jgi:predicted nucleic-acid-binding Zn-ribbon protein
MSEVENCPKCGGEMAEGETLIPKVTLFPKKGRLLGDRVIPTYCKNCGFIELYKEMKREPRFLHV